MHIHKVNPQSHPAKASYALSITPTPKTEVNRLSLSLSHRNVLFTLLTLILKVILISYFPPFSKEIEEEHK